VRSQPREELFVFEEDLRENQWPQRSQHWHFRFEESMRLFEIFFDLDLRIDGRDKVRKISY
jgi:hypothetical protein